MKNAICVLSLLAITFCTAFILATYLFDRLDYATGYYDRGLAESAEVGR